MDTTETYIKMCEKAWEIQKVIYGVDVHKTYRRTLLINHFCYAFDSKNEIFMFAEPDTWLPRQDQLQEMVGGFEAGVIDWGYWCNVVYPEMQDPSNQTFRFKSFEQLWLAFVMKEKFNKRWSSENQDWVKCRKDKPGLGQMPKRQTRRCK